MKNILVLGSGMVAGPLVRYLLGRGDFTVTATDMLPEKAGELIKGHVRGKAEKLDVADKDKLEEKVMKSDLTVSLLPNTMHVPVAEICLKHRKPLVTTSYVSPEMKALDGRAKEAGVILLNEIGLDPGIDHMSAMRVINSVRGNGGKVTSLKSYCGALPAPQSNDNPLGYKFSWSPRGVLLASKNSARYLKDGNEVNTPGERLFYDLHELKFNDIGTFEAYPNRDSLSYINTYGLEGVSDMLRGTLRFPGWCTFWREVAPLPLLDAAEKTGLDGMKYRDFLNEMVPGCECSFLREYVTGFLKLDPSSKTMDTLEWLGFFSENLLPEGCRSNLDVMTALLLEKIPMSKDDIDMIVMRHEFIVEYGSRRERIMSEFIQYGELHGDTAIAKTVGLPAAIAARLVLEGDIRVTGVHVPVIPEIYNPVLDELETMNIVFTETKTAF